ncbi:MAG: hypothetical protein ACLVCH_02915 [Roseburia inulinivorans]
MKKKLSVMTVIILALAICVSAWFYGYYNRKSNDNLPTLTAIAEMSEADVNSLLPGYHIDQLREVWGNLTPVKTAQYVGKLGIPLSL